MTILFLCESEPIFHSESHRLKEKYWRLLFFMHNNSQTAVFAMATDGHSIPSTEPNRPLPRRLDSARRGDWPTSAMIATNLRARRTPPPNRLLFRLSFSLRQ